MNEIRSVSVHLDADVAVYIAKIRLAGAETEKAFSSGSRGIGSTNRALGEAESTLRKVDTQARRVDTSLSRVNTRFSGSNQIDKYSGRLTLIGQTLAAIGPAAVPIAAVAIPAVAGMATGLGALVLGLGTTKLAVAELKPAITALNKAELEPTTANLLAAHVALEKLPPDARSFAREIVSLNPEIEKLRQSAASGLFPGLEVGLREVETLLPQANRLLHTTGAEIGHIAAEAGASLSGPQWRDFIGFITREGPPALEVMARSLGHVTHGVAGLVMAGAPLEHGFMGAVLSGSVNFDHWATGASQTQWFRDLIAYIAANGPRVEHFLGDTAQLVVDIVRDAAPLGGPVLNALDTIAKVLDAIAGSPAGPTILATVSALSLLSRGQAIFGKVAQASWYQAIAGAEGYSAKVSAARVPLLRGGIAAAGLGLSLANAGHQSALLTIASDAMAGTIAGPWGAAIGAGVGILTAFTNHQSTSAAATTDFTSTLNQQTGAITGNTRALAAQTLQQDGALDLAKQLGLNLSTVTSAALGSKNAIAEIQGQLSGITNPQGYSPSGYQVVDPEQVRAARELQSELGLVQDNISGAQAKTRQLSEAEGHNATITEHAAAQHRVLHAQLVAEKQAAGQTAQQFLTLGKDLDNSKVSLDQWIHELAAQAQALAQFGSNAQKAANRGLRDGLIKELEAAGPAGALRMKQLADGTQTQIGRANKAWAAGQRAIASYTHAVTSVPNAHINVDTSSALYNLRFLQAQVDQLHGKTIIVRTVGGHSTISPTGATGGAVRGPGGPTSDDVPAWLSNGEYVMRAAAVNQYGLGVMHAMNAGRFADGGPVSTTSSRVTTGPFASSGLGAAANGVTVALHGLRLESAALTKQLDQERQRRQQIAQQRQQLVSTVRDQFRPQLFGATAAGSSIWSPNGGLMDPLAIINQNIHDSRAYTRDITRLRRRGLRGNALAQVTTLADAQQALGLSPRELHEITRREQVLEQASRRAGRTAGDFRYGRQLAAMAARLETLHHDLEHVNESIKHHEAEQKKNSDHVAGSISTTAGRVGRKATHL